MSDDEINIILAEIKIKLEQYFPNLEFTLVYQYRTIYVSVFDRVYKESFDYEIFFTKSESLADYFNNMIYEHLIALTKFHIENKK